MRANAVVMSFHPDEIRFDTDNSAGWVKPEDLEIGDRFLSYSGQDYKILDIDRHSKPGKTGLLLFVPEGTHLGITTNLFAKEGGEKIWVWCAGKVPAIVPTKTPGVQFEPYLVSYQKTGDIN